MFPELTLLLLLLSTPHLSPTIQLSDMCFIATAVLLTILQSLSDNHILMNNIFASPFPAQSLSLLSLCLPVTRLLFLSHSSLSFSSISAFCIIQIPLVGQSPRRSLYRTLSDESLCSSHRRALVFSELSELHAGPGHAQRHPVQQRPALPQHPTTPHGS